MTKFCKSCALLKFMTDYAKQWNDLLAATQEPEEEPTGEIELLGFKFIGRRIPLALWIRSGRLPEALVRQLLEAKEGAPAVPIDAERLSPGQFSRMVNFQKDAVCESVVEPRIVDHLDALQPGELRYQTLCEKRPDLVDAIVQWVYQNCPGVPVRTKEGDVSVSALSNFPDERQTGKRARSRNGVQALRKTA